MNILDKEWATLHELYEYWQCKDVNNFLELVKERSTYKGLNLYLNDLYELSGDCDMDLDWVGEEYQYYPVAFGLKIEGWQRFFTHLIKRLQVVDNMITFEAGHDFDEGHDQSFYRIVNVDIESVTRSVLAGSFSVTWDYIYVSVQAIKTFEQRYMSIDHDIDLEFKNNCKQLIESEYRSEKEDPKALKVLGLLIHHLAKKTPYKNAKGEPNLSKIKDDVLDVASDLNVDSLGLTKINERLLKDALEFVNNQRDLNKK